MAEETLPIPFVIEAEVLQEEPEIEYNPDGLAPERQAALLDIERKIWNSLAWQKKNIIEMGELLVQAKDTLLHGQFKSWIGKTFGRNLSYRTAALYKYVYENYRVNPDLLEHFSLNFLAMIKRLPEDVAHLIETNHKAFDKRDAKYITQAYQAYRAGEITQEDFRAELMEVLQREADLREAYYAKRRKELSHLYPGVPVKPCATTDDYAALRDVPKEVVQGEPRKDHGEALLMSFTPCEEEEAYEAIMDYIGEPNWREKKHPKLDLKKLMEAISAHFYLGILGGPAHAPEEPKSAILAPLDIPEAGEGQERRKKVG